MGGRFASGKHSIAECDRCGVRTKLNSLKLLTINRALVDIRVCRSCWEPDQPQYNVGLIPVDDPQAVRDPRPDNSYLSSGLTGLQLTDNDFGYPGSGSRVINWGWNPVGFNNYYGLPGLVDNLVATTYLGTVQVVIT